MFSDFIDGMDKDLQSHRDKESSSANQPIADPAKAAKATPATAAKFDLDELEFADEQSVRKEEGLNQSRWADDQDADKAISAEVRMRLGLSGGNQDEAFGFEEYKIPEDSNGHRRQPAVEQLNEPREQPQAPALTTAAHIEDSFEQACAELGLSKTSEAADRPKEMQHVGVVSYVPKCPGSDSASQLKIVNHFEETKISDPTTANEKTLADDWDRADEFVCIACRKPFNSLQDRLPYTLPC